MISFATDFADQAVLLPVACVIAAGLLLAGWRRGALAWSGCIAGVLGLMLLLKMAVFACGEALPWAGSGLFSPSGHTAASATVYGGLLTLVAARSRGGFVVAACIAGAVASLFALTRLALGMHSVSDVLVGAAVGVGGAVAMCLLAGAPPPGLPARLLLASAAVVMILFHGARIPAEGRLRWAASGLWPFSACGSGPMLPADERRATVLERPGDRSHF